MSVFCDEDVPDYIQQDCGIERAGIVAAVLVDKDVTTPSVANLESNSYWTGLTGQSPPDAYILLKTRGEYAPPTNTEEEGFGRESVQVTGAEHEISFEVEGLYDNRDFWEGVNRRKWKLGVVTNGDLLYFIDTPVTITGRINNPRDIKAGAFWMVSCKWQDFSNPLVANVEGLAVFEE